MSQHIAAIAQRIAVTPSSKQVTVSSTPASEPQRAMVREIASSIVRSNIMTTITTGDFSGEQLSALESVAYGPPVACEEVSEEVMGKSLGALKTALPAQRMGAEAGEVKFSVYFKKLAHYGRPALAYACNRAANELEWFPSIAWLKQAMEEHADFQRRERQSAKNILDQARTNANEQAIRVIRYQDMPLDVLQIQPRAVLNAAEMRGYIKIINGKWVYRRSGDESLTP